jgi:hypothetical protein
MGGRGPLFVVIVERPGFYPASASSVWITDVGDAYGSDLRQD